MGQPIRFSEREKQVIELLVQGQSNKQMALALGVSLRTVEFHLSNIYGKLGVTSRTEAALRLSKTDLRETAGELPVKSTVENPGDSNENGFKPILRRIPMRKLYYLLGGLAAIPIIAVIVLKLSAQTPASPPATPVELIPVTNIFAIAPSATSARIATETLPAPAGTNPPASPVVSSHTVNGYTATIESTYVDISHVLLQVRLAGGDTAFGDPHFYDRIGGTYLYDENGNLINTSGGIGPAVDPALYQFEFVPVTLLKGDRLKGQFAFDIRDAPDDYNKILAEFRFDIDLPIYPEARFYPKEVVTANELEMLLDSVTVTPSFTQAYLCFPPPSYAPWAFGSQTILEIGDQETSLYNFRLLFGGDLGGDRRAGSEPYWVPPTKNGRCMKIGFPIGSSDPTSLTLTIPELENLDPDILLTNQLLTNYPGLSEKEAYQTYLEEHGKTYKGPWVFKVELVP